MIDRVSQARQFQSEMVAHRRHLHAEPEVGLHLPDTSDYVAEALRACGLDPEVHEGAGVTARIAGRDADGRTTVLRSDMDALPVEEATGLPFASRRPGAMHACGHDLHMAMLLGAARSFVEEPPLHEVVLVFQPGEEADRGAVPTLAQHRNLDLDEACAFAIHVHATWPRHSINHTDGTFMAYGDWFRVGFTGPGGHASQPHLAGNPVQAAARFVLAAQDLVDELSSQEHLVATVTESLIGNTVNVIPAVGSLRGTIRTLSAARREDLVKGLRRLAEEASAEFRTSAEFELVEGYPAVVNDDAYVADLVSGVKRSVLGDGLARMERPSMVIEDFSYFLRKWPGAMVYLGAQVEGREAFNHAPDADFDESVLATGAALHLMAGDGW